MSTPLHPPGAPKPKRVYVCDYCGYLWPCAEEQRQRRARKSGWLLPMFSIPWRRR